MRILSSVKAQEIQGTLRHSTICTELSYDKKRCQVRRSTDHIQMARWRYTELKNKSSLDSHTLVLSICNMSSIRRKGSVDGSLESFLPLHAAYREIRYKSIFIRISKFYT